MTVKPGIETCVTQDSDELIPEDVYWVLKTGQASLHIALMNGAYAGFLMLNQVTSQYNGSVKLNVWYAHHTGTDVNVIAESLAQLEEMAGNINATAITFRSDRLSFERWGSKLGFKIREFELVKEV